MVLYHKNVSEQIWQIQKSIENCIDAFIQSASCAHNSFAKWDGFYLHSKF